MNQYKIERTDGEINDVLDACVDQEIKGVSKWPGMTYEDGVSEAIHWIIGQTEDDPMQD